jgi:hypothetical protein
MSKTNKLDSDSEDDRDYVPTKKELKQAGVEDIDEPVKEKELTGIALIKD